MSANTRPKTIISFVRISTVRPQRTYPSSSTDNAGVWSEIEDHLHDSVDGPVKVPEYWEIKTTKIKKVFYKMTGKGIAVNLVGTADIDEPKWEAVEPEMDVWEEEDEYGSRYMTDGRSRAYIRAGSKSRRLGYDA